MRVFLRELVFWIQWVLATAVGLVAGAIWVFFVHSDIVRQFPHPLIVTVFAVAGASGSGFPVAGAVAGALQWLVIRRRCASRAALWLLANALGFAAGDYAGGLPRFGFASPGLPIGLVVGSLEGLVLRWQLSRTGLWVLANAIGFAAGYVVGVVVGFDTGWRYGANTGALVGYTVGGAVAGAITGIALVLLLRRLAGSCGLNVGPGGRQRL